MQQQAGKKSNTQFHSATTKEQTSQKQNTNTPVQFANHRPQTIQVQQLREMVNNSPKMAQMKMRQEMVNNSPKIAQLRAMQEMVNNSSKMAQMRARQAMVNNSSKVTQLRAMQEMRNEYSSNHQSKIPHQTENTNGVIQRKIILNDTERAEQPNDADEVKAASADNYSRFYTNEIEMQKHLVSKEPVGIGLIKSKAHWYRIPALEQQQFFVFGENHNAITGEQIYVESNVKKPILREGLIGVGFKDHIKNIQDNANTEGKSVGLDENGSKLLRAFEFAINQPLTAFPPRPAPNPANIVNNANEIPLPTISEGELHARDKQKGSYNLAVRGDDGQAEWWKQPEGVNQQAPQMYSAPTAKAIHSLFPKVFKGVTLTDAIQEAWGYIGGTDWQKVLENDSNAKSTRTTILREYLFKLFEFTEDKVKADYSEFRKGNEAGRKELNGTPLADDFRNEYLLAGIKEGAKNNKYALANIGAKHLKAINNRLENIPAVTNNQLFGAYGKLAIQPPNPFDSWLNQNPPSLNAPPSSYTFKKSDYEVLQENLQAYLENIPTRSQNMQPLLIRAENLMLRKRQIWTANNNKRDRVGQVDALISYLKTGIDLQKKCYK